MRMLLTGEAEGVGSGAAEGVPDSAGEADTAGTSSVVADGIGVADSWANEIDTASADRIAKFVFNVIQNRVHTSPSFNGMRD